MCSTISNVLQFTVLDFNVASGDINALDNGITDISTVLTTVTDISTVQTTVIDISTVLTTVTSCTFYFLS